MNDSPSPAEAIFLVAIELPVADRAAYLDDACRGNPELRQRVARLLAAQDEAGDFMATHDFRRSTPVTPALHEEPGDRIGRYKLIQEIGKGGFGTVWMAEQTEPVRRPVALKIIKLGMDTREVVARFEAERQALAMMQHPHIAQVFDAGATEAGRPYFVMELVRGRPITRYCDEEALPMQQRLALFVQVCHAIQHAHQKGIIHRDIKPSNVLVTIGDEGPVPKVIDFGIAKAMNTTLTESTLRTQFHQLIGTPAYMSPEQAGTGPLDIDTRSDVYALGVLLYELLTGRPPFDPQELLKGGLEEMRRVIRDEDPPKPSTCLSTMQQPQLTAMARNRHIQAPQLVSDFKGELDWIVMKALEKHRARRYESAIAFAADVDRYLRHETVIARPPTRVYLLGKFIRRHKTAVIAGSVVALSLVVGALVSGWQAFEAIAERNRAIRAEQDADRQRKLSEDDRDRHQYAANMHLAAAAWDQGHVGRIRQILEETRSHPERGFEWGFWQRQCHLELRTLRGHRAPVRAVGISSDGGVIVSASDDGVAKVWDAGTGQERFTLKGHEGSVLSVALSPDDRYIATGGGDKSVRIWDAETGRLIHILQGHATSIKSAVFSAGGRRLATSDEYVARLWDVGTGRELFSISDGTNKLLAIAFAGLSSERIHACHQHGSIGVWDASSGSEVQKIRLVLPASVVAISPDGRQLASLDALSDTTDLVDATTGRKLRILAPMEGVVPAGPFVFSPDGRWVLAGANNHNVQVWKATTGEPAFTLKGHSGAIRAIAVSSQGNKFVTAGDDNTVKVWYSEANYAAPYVTLKKQVSRLTSLAFSPDGGRVLIGGEDGVARLLDYNAVDGVEWSLFHRRGREVRSMRAHTKAITSVAFSSGGQLVLTGSLDSTARVWDAKTGHVMLTLSRHAKPVWSVAFSPDGSQIITGSDDGTARIWQTATGKEEAVLAGHSACVSAAVFSPDGHSVVTGSADDTARIWDVRTRREVVILRGHAKSVWGVAFSPDGSTIATASDDQTAKLWSNPTGRELVTFRGHSATVRDIAFLPDGRRVVTASSDGTAKIWDAKTGRELLTLRGHRGAVSAVACSPNGTCIITAGADSTPKMWLAASSDEVDEPGTYQAKTDRLSDQASNLAAKLEASRGRIGAATIEEERELRAMQRDLHREAPLIALTSEITADLEAMLARHEPGNAAEEQAIEQLKNFLAVGSLALEIPRTRDESTTALEVLRRYYRARDLERFKRWIEANSSGPGN